MVLRNYKEKKKRQLLHMVVPLIATNSKDLGKEDKWCENKDLNINFLNFDNLRNKSFSDSERVVHAFDLVNKNKYKMSVEDNLYEITNIMIHQTNINVDTFSFDIMIDDEIEYSVFASLVNLIESYRFEIIV
jgi:hypothetical protein